MVLLALAALVGACGRSGFQYVHNDQVNAYFKVPDDWTLFSEREILGLSAIPIPPLERQRLLARTWMRGFDASPRPSPLNVVDVDGPHPRGYAQVRALTDEERSAISLSDLRSLGLGGLLERNPDPIKEVQDNPHGPVEILSSQDVVFPGGTHGIRMEVAADTPSGRVVVVDYTAVVDAETRLLYLFVIGCQERCYFNADNQSQIKTIADSWMIKEP